MTLSGPITDLRQLVQAIDTTGRYDRLLSLWTTYEAARELIADADAIATARFADGTVRLRLDDLARLLAGAPHQVLAFVQALTETGSPQMLVMVWRILRGMQIARVDLNYALADSFRMTVALRPLRGTADEEVYESTDVFDFNLLRHATMWKHADRPVLDGFLPIT